MKKIKIFPLLLLVCMLLGCFGGTACALDYPATEAQAIVLADANTGSILYSVNMNERRSPASLTKIMTGLIAVQKVESGEISLTDVVTAQYDCQRGMDSDSSNAGIMEGEQMTFGDLMSCAMVHSANDACNVIARYIAGSIDDFVAMMNEEAARLGCTDTHFADPCGLANEDHYSTAYDLFLMTQEAVKHELFVKYANTLTAEIPATNLNKARTYYNSNALLTADSQYGSGYVYEGASGVKTGYTRKAGYCLISSAERNDVRLVAVVLGCNGQLNSDSTEFGNFVDTIKLYDWAFENFSYREVLNNSTVACTIPVALSTAGEATLYPAGTLTMLLPNDLDLDTLELRARTYEASYTAPLAAGEELGEAEVIIEGVSYGTIKLVLNNSVALSKSQYMRMKLAETLGKTWVRAVIIILAVLLIAYFALVLRYRSLRRKHLKAKKLAEQRRRQQAAARER